MIIMRINKSKRRNLNFKIINTNFKNFLLIFSLALILLRSINMFSCFQSSVEYWFNYTCLLEALFCIHTYTHVITHYTGKILCTYILHTRHYTGKILCTYTYTHVITQVQFYVQCTYILHTRHYTGKILCTMYIHVIT